nr:unnamed protein product [Callosobruchus analis]
MCTPFRSVTLFLYTLFLDEEGCRVILYSFWFQVILTPLPGLPSNATSAPPGDPAPLLWPIPFDSPMPLDASEGGLFAGGFVPPPPRPTFIDDSATPDGPTTCDLCSWAWQNTGGGTGSGGGGYGVFDAAAGRYTFFPNIPWI